MKLRTLITAGLITSLATLAAEQIVIDENFEGYPLGELPEEGEWPANSQHFEQSWRWQIGRRSGPQAIVSGSDTGSVDVNGQLYRFVEAEPSHLTTHSSLQLPERIGSDAQWKLTIRFYIEALEHPGVVTLVSLYDGDVETESARAQGRITSYALSRNSRTGEIQASVAREGDSSFFRKTLTPQTWYTLEIRGDNQTRKADLSIYSDSFSDHLSSLTYASPAESVSHITIGDVTGNQWHEGRNNVIFIDRLTLTQSTAP